MWLEPRSRSAAVPARRLFPLGGNSPYLACCPRSFVCFCFDPEDLGATQVMGGTLPAELPATTHLEIACGCNADKAGARVTKVMLEWFLDGQDPFFGESALDAESPLEEPLSLSNVQRDPTYDLVSVMRALDSKIIVLDRSDDIASYVSMRLLDQCFEQSNVQQQQLHPHDLSPSCAESKVHVDVGHLAEHLEKQSRLRQKREVFLEELGLEVSV